MNREQKQTLQQDRQKQ